MDEEAGGKPGRAKRRIAGLAAVAGLVPMLVVGSLLLGRISAPAQKDRVLFPVYNDGLMVQNWGFWLAGRTYGHQKAYRALQAATARHRGAYPGSRVAFLDASGRKEGKLGGHLSHRKGIDVDILFMGRTGSGGMYPNHPALFKVGYYIDYDIKGGHRGLQFDAGRTWHFIACLRDNGVLKVEKIFVEPYIEEWLLQEARRQKAPAGLIRWAKDTLGYAGDKAADHKDHMHVRFAEP